MSNETHCRYCGEQSTQTTCEKCENAAISVEFRRRKDALAKCSPPIDWKARCEKAEGAAETAKQNAMSINELWAKEIARVGELEAELAAIKGKVEYRLLPDRITCDYGLSFEQPPISVPAFAADGLLANPPLGYQIERRVNYQSPWRPADPRAGEMTKGQK